MKPYNRSELFDKKLLPLVNRLQALCSGMGIPAFMAFAVENSEEGTRFKRFVVNGMARQKLKEDAISTAMLRSVGFGTDLPEYIDDALSALENYDAERNRGITYYNQAKEEDLSKKDLEFLDSEGFSLDDEVEIYSFPEFDDYEQIFAGKLRPVPANKSRDARDIHTGEKDPDENNIR